MSASHRYIAISVLLAALSLSLTRAGPAAAQTGATQVQGFETFVLPNPTQPSPTTGKKSGQQSSALSKQSAPSGQSKAEENLAARLALTLFPGSNDLGIFVDGNVAGRTLTTQLSPLHWMQGDYANSGYIELSHDGQGVSLGDTPLDQLGNTQSLRLFGLGNGPYGSISASLYHGISEMNPFRGTPAIDDDFHTGSGMNTDFLVASDSSWRVSQKLERKKWQVSTFAGRDKHTDRNESGLFASAQPDKRSSLYSNLTSWTGSQPGFDWSAGAAHRLGPLFAGVDNIILDERPSLLRELGVGVILPLRASSLAVRVQSGQIDPEAELGIGNQHSNITFGSYSAMVNPQTVLSITGGSSTQSGFPEERFVTVGASRALNDRWSLYAQTIDRLDTGAHNFQLAVGCRISPEWQVRVLCGPSAVVTDSTQPPEVLGLQITRSLNIKKYPTGTIRGLVTLEGKPYLGHLPIWLDGQPSVKTDSGGCFKIARVPPGEHDIQVPPACLPADLCPDKFDAEVDVVSGKTTELDFSIRRVSVVHGSVKVLPDALGKIDPTAGIGVTICAGASFETTTDEQGSFVLGDMPAGNYDIVLNKNTIPPDFAVVGPDSIPVTIVPDQPVPYIQFTIQPARMNIEFADTGSPGSAAPSGSSGSSHSAASVQPVSTVTVAPGSEPLAK